MHTKPTMAFVDHSFHQKTHSGDFLRELFSSYFDIVNIWDDSWNGGEKVDINKINKCEYVFYFQVISPLKELRRVTAKIIWTPMYDGVKFDYLYWKALSFLPIKVLCFSEKIYLHCKKFGIEAISVQYFIDPNRYGAYNLPKKGATIFFWYRGGIKFNDIKKIIDPKQIDRFIYKSNPDPSYKKEVISTEDIRDFKMEIIESGYSSKEEYLSLLSQANIFIAPRKKEGIGLSFIEAMAMGQCVMGNNEGTINEYIVHGDNGYLFNLRDQRMLDLSTLADITKRSKESASRGYSKWRDDTEEMIKFISSPLSQITSKYTNKPLFIIYIILGTTTTFVRRMVYLFTRFKNFLT